MSCRYKESVVHRPGARQESVRTSEARDSNGFSGLALAGSRSGEESRVVKCKDCGAEFPPEVAGAVDRSCTECGSSRLVVFQNIAEEMGVREDLHSRVKDPRYSSKRNPRVISKVGASYWHDEKKWMHREMLVDKNQGRYRKVISDPETGEIVRECEEPLPKHRGHGDDKPGPSTNEED